MRTNSPVLSSIVREFIGVKKVALASLVVRAGKADLESSLQDLWSYILRFRFVLLDESVDSF